MHPETKEELKVRFKLVVLELASELEFSKICKEFNVPRSTFYRWKKRYDQAGRAGLYIKKPIAYSHPRKTSPEVIEKILELRSNYQTGA
jgi:transposase